MKKTLILAGVYVWNDGGERHPRHEAGYDCEEDEAERRHHSLWLVFLRAKKKCVTRPTMDMRDFQRGCGMESASIGSCDEKRNEVASGSWAGDLKFVTPIGPGE